MQLKFTFFALALLGVLLFATCEDDDNGATTGDVELDFKAVYDGQPFQTQSVAYDYPGDAEVKFQIFQFYLSDVTLLGENTTADHLLSEVELVRFRDQFDITLARAGVNLPFTNVPVGTYRAVRFGLGVKPELNARPPSEFAADFALNENEYWGPAGMYVFAKIEGNAQVDNDGLFDDKLTYHMGRNDYYVTVTSESPLTVSGSTPAVAEFQVDLEKVMARSANDYLNIADTTIQVVHGSNQEVLQYLWQNLQTSLVRVSQ
ncbi:MAG: MbnP family protein [Saprospiraceae bacterium]